MREIFNEHYQRHLKSKLLPGVIEIDESLFGRKVKYHRGNPHMGLCVWVFGMVERDTNTVLLFPVTDRRDKTLIPIIQRHGAPGSTINSDRWSSYCSLNDFGYDHFTVIHKNTFKKVYKNVATGQLISVHTNR